MPGEDLRGWRSYDSVADQYARVAEPRFSGLARDLVAAVAPRSGEAVLDVGTGTGLAARTWLAAAGSGGLVVGVDPSRVMLERAQTADGVHVAVAVVPGLPFGRGVFDVVLANLVLSHVSAVEDALVEISSVLRRRGRFGCTAWGPAEPASEQNQQVEASDLIDEVRRAHDLVVPDSANAQAWPVPWEDRFRERDRLSGVLEAAGLEVAELRMHTCRDAIPVETFAAGGSEWGARGRYLREVAGEPRWHAVHERTVAQLRDRFGEQINAVNHFWIAVTTRP